MCLPEHLPDPYDPIMSRILISGLINLETTLKIESFPLTYEPVRYASGVTSSVAGVGYNIARALMTLGHKVQLASIIGQDAVGDLVLTTLERDGLSSEFIRRDMASTAQSVILYDASGARAIHTDLKDVQDRSYPNSSFETALEGCAAVIVCNKNFSRPLLKLLKARGIPVITDLHALQNLENPYDTDFLEAADIVFFSHERLQEPPETVIQQLFGRFRTRLIVVGLGAQGALLAARDEPVRFVPAVNVRPVVSTVGAGDSLLSGFVHGFTSGLEPVQALERAVIFAAHKIGAVGAAKGFLTHSKLELAWQALNPNPPTST
jgi:acarbose 7IV-phosphotransferase